MELAPDFFSYFAATALLLDADDSLLCVSSWNDHGQAALVRDATRLLRTDFFPGLGWMLTARLWDELRCGAECVGKYLSAGCLSLHCCVLTLHEPRWMLDLRLGVIARCAGLQDAMCCIHVSGGLSKWY